MNSLNSIMIEGNLVRDPQLRESPKGTKICTFSVASNRYIKQNDAFERETSFFDIETWSKLAEACLANLRKGRGVRIVGRLHQDRWTDADGKAKSRVKIIAEHVEFKPELKAGKADQRNVADFPVVAGEGAAESAAVPF